MPDLTDPDLTDPDRTDPGSAARPDLVDWATGRLAETTTLPLDAHAEIYDDVHAALRDALDPLVGD
jgi:hypothetical protein